MTLFEDKKGLFFYSPFFGQNISVEMNADGSIIDLYIRGVGLISSDANGCYLYNAHGGVVQLTNGTGMVTKEYHYDAFGNEHTPDPADANPFRYCGEYFDKEIGTIYLRARYYDPATSRMLSEDTIRARHINVFDPHGYYQEYQLNGGVFRDDEQGLFIVTDSLSLNLYTYCQSNPIMYQDASGHLPLLAITGLIGAVAGGIYGYVKTGTLQGTLGYAAVGGVIGLTGGAAISIAATGTATATGVFSAIGWGAASAGGTAGISAYQIGRNFEQWFYSFKNIAQSSQQIVIKGVGRLDAFSRGTIYELKIQNNFR